jgi:DMSO/TMAO reductase YedYZ molybdopterin-dependent catalytic subunit
MLVAVLALGTEAASLPFVPYDVFEWVTRLLPGPIVTIGIDAIVALITTLHLGATSVAAKSAEQGLAVGLFVATGSLLGAIATRARSTTTSLLAAAACCVAWLTIALASEIALGRTDPEGIAWVVALMFAWGIFLGWALRAAAVAADETPVERTERRRFLAGLLGGAAAGSAAIVGLLALFRRGRAGLAPVAATGGPNDHATSGVPRENVAPPGPAPAPSSASASASSRIAAVHGTRPELTPNERFYRIDINLKPPSIDGAKWRLRVGGMVDEPLSLSLDELRAMPSITQTITLECISNRVGGDLIGTTRWTGVRLRDVLRRAKARAEVRAVHMKAADGFYESVGADDMNDERTMLVYAMNGAPLTEEHGFPLRVFIPNRHGMKQPKWITEIAASDRDGPGYWVDRGWSKEAIVHTTSVIDTVGMSMTIGSANVVPVGGIAYAGARGISKVEVQVDDEPWAEAKLIAPPLSPLTWVLWRFEWPYKAGKHVFKVRAYDGKGVLQDTQERPPHPDGATGVHSMTVNV